MKIAIAENALFALQRGLTVNQQPNGKVTLSRADGKVRSVQPDSSIQWRDPGTAGQYELATPTPHGYLYEPLGDRGEDVGAAYLFPFVTQS